MKIKSTQLHFSIIEEIDFDVAFYSCGYEERARYLKQTFNIKANSEIVLSFFNEDRLKYSANKTFFKKCVGIDHKILKGESNEEIFSIINNYIKDIDKEELNILIDYSSMTSVWFSSFLTYFKYNSIPSPIRKINLYYSYSHAKYTSPINETDKNLIVNPLFGYSNLSIPDKPTALIIGLGYEKNKATGLAQYLDADSYIFYTDSSYAEEFHKQVLEENASLLSEVKDENIFQYPILDLDITSNLLHSLVSDLLQTNRIVLAPCGPKIFTLLCLVESLINENVDVWRISSSKDCKKVSNKVPNDKVSLYRITFDITLDHNE